MSNLVIVAIPDENDRVWKVSSEKVPHMTLLFLGDMGQVANVDQIVGFVEHATNTTLRRFYMPVDRRGELGADQADVLFFKKGRYDYKAIRDFRAALLQDNNIKTAYDNATQFEGPWNPHLTLGYPAAPAKSIPDDQVGTFYDVGFTKIAVWTGDFEGPEFLLKDYWDEYDTLDAVPMDVAMSAVRHAVTVSDTPWSDFPDSDFDDDQWKRSCILDRGADFNTSKQRYAIPVREPSGTLNRKAIARAAAILSSKGGFGNARGNKINATHEQLVTARNKLIAIYNSVGEDVPEGLKTEVKQSAELGAEFALEHFGVKGMRWGVRKADVAGAAKTAGKAVGRGADAVAFELHASDDWVHTSILLGARSKLKQDLPAIKEKHSGTGADKRLNRMKNPRSPEARAYRADVKAAYLKRLEERANEHVSVTGSRRYTLKEHGKPNTKKYYWRVATEANPAKHAATAPGEVDVHPVFDEEGWIIDIEPVDDTMAQSADLGSEFILEHFGVKGMRWGVRKDAPAAVAPAAVSRVPQSSRRKTKVKTTGGENHPAHPDALKVAESRTKLKKSGTAALSNQELRDVANRLQLEQQVVQLTSSRGKKFVTRQVEQEGQQQLQRGIRRAAPHVVKRAGKAAATGAATAALL
jgi:2'-5' RNA ligase